MSLFITQCPHCHTSFRTSVSQLQSADGMVRCGACLRVFAADDNLLPSLDIRTINVPAPEEAEVEEIDELDEQLSISELEIDEENVEKEKANVDSIVTFDMADSIPNRLSPRISTNEPLWEFVEADEASAEIEADNETPQLSVPEETEKTIAEHEFEPLRASNATEIEAPKANAPSPSVPREEHAQIRSRMTAIDFDDDILHDNANAKRFARFSAEEIEGVSDAASPLELDWEEAPQRRGPNAAILLLILLLTLSIAGQFAWFNKDMLSQDSRLRPLLEGFCAALRCELPAQVNIRAIRSDTLLVRSHTEIANALSVNFQFRNDASFAQPFPGLSLRFLDANDTLIAQRNFAPQEYLPEGVADLRLMPPDAPVQVRLDILDPGGKAINYELNFYAH